MFYILAIILRNHSLSIDFGYAYCVTDVHIHKLTITHYSDTGHVGFIFYLTPDCLIHLSGINIPSTDPYSLVQKLSLYSKLCTFSAEAYMHLPLFYS